VDKLALDKKTIWFVLINLGLIALFTAINNLLMISIPEPSMFSHHGPGPGFPGGGEPSEFHKLQGFFKPDRKMIIVRDLGTFIVPIIISVTLKVFARLKKTEAEKKEIQHEHLQSELSQLKQQLHPHFFFNSLNNIYALIDISPEKSKEAVHGFAKLIRYLLYETNTEQVSLDKEIEFIGQYISLMKLRLSEKTQVKFEYSENALSMSIAPLLFLPLVENAFKHGVSATVHSDIEISLAIKDGDIILNTSNTIFEQNEPDHQNHGIGLENLRKRLDLLYPGRYQLTTREYEKQYISTLLIKKAKT
jgi:LytS/YehU family sensor histidine kinase